MTCRCRCGYRCGGPGVCKAKGWDCLSATDGQHFVKDCDHKWDGPAWESQDGCMSSATCSACGMAAIHHDMRNGP
jgi:hypothetical protein